MKMLIVIFITLFILSQISADEVRGITCRPLSSGSVAEGRAEVYIPPAVPKTSPEISTVSSRDEWELIDSLQIDSFLRAGNHFGVYFDNFDNTIEVVTNQEGLSQVSELAVSRAPVWMRAELENTLSQLSASEQQEWAQVILNAVDPYVDEIAFSVANSSVQYLESEYAYPQLFIDNAHLMYEIDLDLNYVEIVDYGTSNDEDYYSTTRYWKRSDHGDVYQVEVPRAIYYWYVVHPKITDEIPAYIDPDVIESNTSHQNNIVPPGEGVFWRNFLYNHNDAGYPKLRYYLESCDIVWDGTSLSSTNAVGAADRWIGESMVFTSNSERPHQPVRIYRKHIGRCGEHADLRAAALRIGLIPATSILTISTDHTWNEFWDESWIHYDGGSVNNPLLYENGWGKVHGSVFEIRSDGVLTSVSDKYSEGTASITIYVIDPDGVPVDGARIILGMLDGTSIRTDMVGFTDNEGKYEFIVGENRTYYGRMTSDLGDYPMSGNYLLLVENAEDGGEYSFSMNTYYPINTISFNPVDAPNDDVDDYLIAADFSASRQVIHGEVPFDDVPNSEFYQCLAGGCSNLFFTDLIQYSNYIAGFQFDTFLSHAAAESGFSEYDIPDNQWWYSFFDNYQALGNADKIVGSIALYRNEDEGGSGVICGTVIDAYDAEALENAVITAGVFQTTSDENGDFSLEVFPQNYDVLCEAEGYELNLSENIQVGNDETVTLDLELFESALMAQNVTAIQNDNDQAEISWNEPLPSRKKRRTDLRDLEGYNVYRGLCDEDDLIESWTLLTEGISQTDYTDTEWENLEPGIYKYAVESVYSEDNVSPRAFSNDLFNRMFAAVSIDIFTNSGDDTQGASVTLTNQDDHPLHIYSDEADENGEVYFEEVWKGVYELSITLENFATYHSDSLQIFEDTSLEITLEELLTPVYDLSVIDYILYWSSMQASRELLGYNVYRDDVLVSQQQSGNTFDLSGSGGGVHTAGVSAVYTTGESDLVSIEYEDGNSTFCGIYAYYPFDGNFNDESGNGFDGEMVGYLTFSDDVIAGQSVHFDEELEYVSIPGIFTEAPSAFSVSWWLNPASHTNWNQQLRSPAGWDGFVFHTTNEGSFYVGTNVDTRLTPSYFEERMILAEWQFFTFAYGNGRGRLFKNGDEIGFKDGMADPASWNGFRIGDESANTIDGDIDEVRLWDRAVGSKEVEYLYTEFVPFWGNIEGTVISAVDQTPVSNATIKAGMFEISTDIDGNYALETASATYRVICSYQDYDPQIIEDIFVGNGETVTVDFEYEFTSHDEECIDKPDFALSNFPNPFHLQTTISFSITELSENTKISIYNIRGQEVKTFPNQQIGKSANQQITWNGKDDQNRPVSSGIYFYRLDSGDFSRTRKMILMR